MADDRMAALELLRKAAGDGDLDFLKERGQWTNITLKKLTSMLKHKDFTLLNVRTPYVGEMAGTDLCIPYPNITAHASELPTDKIAKIVVYCWTGHESAIAAQTLVDLGHTNIDNLDGWMTAWTASGGQLVHLTR